MARKLVRAWALISVSAAVVLFAGLWAIDLATAQAGGDGRINLIAPLGGATIYCVDAAMQPATSYVGGGIRVLDSDGLEVLFAPAGSIPSPGADPVLLAEGQGRYSVLMLYLLPSGEFQLNGADDKGQPFEFRWTGCAQQGAAVAAATAVPVANPTATPEPGIVPTLTPTVPACDPSLCEAQCAPGGVPNESDEDYFWYLTCVMYCVRNLQNRGLCTGPVCVGSGCPG